MENLIFRHQFLLTNRRVQFDASWKTNKLTKCKTECFINLHPDLDVYSAANNDAELILLGYVIDPFHPKRTNQDIVDTLLLSSSFDAVAAGTDTLNGRFVLIYNTSNTIKILHDATGFREVYYFNDSKDFACGSTPDIIAHKLKIERDTDKELNNFFNSPQFNNGERRWIGARTIFKGVSKLLPNHYVDLLSNTAIRYWPRDNKKTMNLNETSIYLAKILTGTYDSAISRFKLQQSITSGWDTRVLLASCSRHKEKIKFYFNRGFKTDRGLVNSEDYLVTKKIAEKYGIPIRFIEFEDKIDKKFENIYYANNLFARPKLLRVYYNAYLNKLDNVITVSGTMGNEILRLMSSLNRNSDRAQVFASTFKYQNFPFVIKTINEWLDSSRYLRDKGYNLVDLFHWEMFFGNWGALSGSEQDIIMDELRPFNNREFISTFISLPDKYRYRDYPLGYVKIIELLWPELLNFGMDIQNYKLKKALRIVHLEQLADKVYQKIKA